MNNINIIEFASIYSDNPLVQYVSIAFIFFWLLVTAATRFFKFHDENIRFRKSKHISEAAKDYEDGSDDWHLFNESRTQELFYANTGIYASKNQRKTITLWLLHNNVSINILKKAWPAIKVEKGELVTEISDFDKFYYWLSFASIMLFTLLLVPTLIISVLTIYQNSSWALTIYPIFFAAMVVFTYKNVEPVIFLRKLNQRLCNC